MDGDGAGMTSLQAALQASQAQQSNHKVVTTGHHQLPAPSLTAHYWSAYLHQLQLPGQPNASAPASSLPAALLSAPAAAKEPASLHAHILKAVGQQQTQLSTPMQQTELQKQSEGPHVPRAIRASDMASPLDGLAAALKRPGAGPSAFTAPSAFSSTSAFAAAAGNAWNDREPASSPNSAAMRRAGSDGLKRLNSDSLRRAGSDGLRHGSSGTLRNGPTGPIMTGKRSASLKRKGDISDKSLPFKKRPDLNVAPSTDDGNDSAEEGAEMALFRMRSGEAPPAPQSAPAAEEEHTPKAGAAVAAPKCSKEKNRQAQRRFRERQKNLIGELRDTVRGLEQDVEAQAKQIFVLQEENRLLQMLLQERQGMHQGIPPGLQQSLQQGQPSSK